MRRACHCVILFSVLVCLMVPDRGMLEEEPATSVLLLIPRADQGAVSLLQQKNIPVNFKLGDYLVVEAGPDDLEMFSRIGIACELIDDTAWSEPYYLISRPAGGALGLLPDIGMVVYRTDREAIVKVAEDSALKLIGNGFRLVRIFQDSLPLESGADNVVPALLKLQLTSPSEIIETIVTQVSDDSLRATVQRLQDFRTRYFATDSIHAAAQWLYDTFMQYGYTDVVFDTCEARPSGVIIRNVIATKPGTVDPDLVFLIGGHYDSIVHDGGNSMIWAPGADDNASGTAAALEAARVLSEYDLDYTVRFACWTAEEIGLYGSHDYAAKAHQRGERIGLSINFDMIGNYDATDPLRDISIMRPASCSRFGDLMADVAETYTTLVPRQYAAGGGSDHVPFMQYGFNVVYGEEGDFSPNWHRGSDIIDNMDMAYLGEVVRMGVGTLATLTLGLGQPDIVFDCILFNEVQGNGDDGFDPGETIDLVVNLRNPGLGCASGLTAILETDVPGLSITDNLATYPACGINAIVGNSADPFTLTLAEEVEVNPVPFTLHVTEQGSGFQTDLEFRLLTGQGRILLVADDGGVRNQEYYTRILNGLGIQFDVNVGDGRARTTAPLLDGYDEIIWFTGPVESSTLTVDDQVTLAEYLDTGGRLLLSGSLIGYDIGTTDFYREYLHARHMSFMTRLYHLRGTSNGLVGEMNLALADDGSNGQGFAGETDPVGTAFSLFTYDRSAEEGPGTILSTGSGALAVETAAYKLAYFSFGLEGIEPEEDRTDVLLGILSWFKTPGVDKGDVDGNGTINIIDAMTAVTIVLGIHEGTADELARADMNCDEKVNVLDVLGVVNAILTSGAAPQ